jgi:anti-sigma B factor antagonist
MNVLTERRDGLVVLRFEDSTALDAATGPDVKTKALARIDGTADLVADLGALEFVDSYGLSVLISLMKAARTKRRRMVFAGARTNICEVFRIIQLDRIFDLFPDVDRAVRALTRNEAVGQATSLSD